MQRDSIDFAGMKVGRLFGKLWLPTLLGMVSSALFIITDGIFVGRGVGSDALAAVNVTAPLFMFSAALGLMFGMGGAIVASINLSRGKPRVASINTTQSIAVSGGLMLLVAAIVLLVPAQTAAMLGAPDDLMPMVKEYVTAFMPFAIFHTLLNVLNFFTRIDGPRVAMICMTLSAGINIALDYVFIFPLGWGLTGAAVATGIGEAAGSVVMIAYLVRRSPRVKLVRLKTSLRSLMLTARNSWYMVRLGFSAFLNQIAIALMMLTGNYIFGEYVGTDGIAAFSVVCYLFPIIYMVFDSVAQSAQPIVSFNYGAGHHGRVRRALGLSMVTAAAIGISFTLLGQVAGDPVVSLFITDRSSDAWQLASQGLKLFSFGFLFFGINIASVGYFMSVEKTTRAMIFTVLRGVVFPVLCFFVLPLHLGISGIWLAVPVSEALITLALVLVPKGRKAPQSERISRTVEQDAPAVAAGYQTADKRG